MEKDPLDRNEKIEAFLLGKMTDTERKAFQNELDQDQDLADTFMQYKHMIEGVRMEAAQEFKSKLASIQKEVNPAFPTTKSTSKYIRLIGWAAAAACLLFVGYWTFYSSGPSSPQELYIAYYQAFPFEAPSRTQTKSTSLVEIQQLYNNRDFSATINEIDEYTKNGSTNILLWMIAGSCHLELQQVDLAIPYFQKVIDSQEILYHNEAKWYLALSWLHKNDPDAARPLLLDLSQNKNADHHSEATALLKKLKD